MVLGLAMAHSFSLHVHDLGFRVIQLANVGDNEARYAEISGQGWPGFQHKQTRHTFQARPLFHLGLLTILEKSRITLPSRH